jgi:hypothetical protein
MAKPKEVAPTDVTNPIETGANTEDQIAQRRAIFQRVADAYQEMQEAEENHAREYEELMAGHREAISAAVKEAAAISPEWRVNGVTHKVRAFRGGNGELLGMTGFRPTATPKAKKENTNVVEL